MTTVYAVAVFTAAYQFTGAVLAIVNAIGA